MYINFVFENLDILFNNIKTDVLLYGDTLLDGESKKIILEVTISSIKTSERFTGSNFWLKCFK